MIKNIFLIFSSDITSRLLSFILTFLLAKFLNVDNFGRFNYIITTLSLYSLIIQPFAAAYIRDFRYLNLKEFDFSYNIISLFLFIPVSYIFYKILNINNFLIYIIFFFYQLVLINIQYYFNVFEKYKNYSLINIFQQIIFLIIVISWISINHTNNVEVLICLMYGGASILLFVYFSKKVQKFFLSLNFSKIVEFLNNSIYLVLYWFIIPLINFFDFFFIDKFLTKTELGYYAFALKIFNISMIAIPAMLTVFRITQIDIVKQGKVYIFFKENFIKVLSFSIIIYIGMIIFANILIKIFFKKYYLSLIPSIILISTSFISYLTIPFSFLMAARKYREVFYIGFIGLFLSILIKLLFINKYKIIAVAFSTFMGHSFINISFFILSLLFFRKNKN